MSSERDRQIAELREAIEALRLESADLVERNDAQANKLSRLAGQVGSLERTNLRLIQLTHSYRSGL